MSEYSDLADALAALTAERKKVDLLREMLMMYHDADDDCDGGCIVAHILAQTAPEEDEQ